LDSRTRERIIDSMCLTWRHDFGVDKGRFCGMTDDERSALRSRMAQLFDNDIAPHMEIRREERPAPKIVRDGIIKVQSFELTEREKRRISLGLKYGPAAAYMMDDGTPLPAPETPRSSWRDWIFGKFLGRS
jgi:hypothetical protein